MRKHSQYFYETQPQVQLERSSFNRSHMYKTVFQGGYLIPMFVDEVLPGDTFNHSSHFFARLTTPIFPIMDNLYLESFYFFVPNRLVWSNWTKFMGDKDPGDVTTYVVPSLKSSASTAPYQLSEASLFDYMGIPTKVPNLQFNVLPLRCYNLIYNRWFMDENLGVPAVIRSGDSGDTFADYLVRLRGKKRDYFTSAFPWPQKGSSVTIPASGQSKVLPGATEHTTGTASLTQYRNANTGAVPPNNTMMTLSGSLVSTTTAGANGVNAGLYPSNLYSLNINSATINDLREAFQLQKLLERDARGGTRYIEQLFSHFGVINPDFRLQEPELLSVHRQNVNINPIAQTSSTDATSPQGNLAAFGTSNGSNHYIKSFTEHGFIIGLVNLRAELTYQQGLNRMWSRDTKYDYFWPALAHLGEQAILNKEIYAQGSAVLDSGVPVDDKVFGYIPRFDEYRYKESIVTAAFRSNAAQSLDTWHLTQEFSSLPTLNWQFIDDYATLAGVTRVEAVANAPQMLLDCYHNLNTVRVMPTYAIPGMVDHF